MRKTEVIITILLSVTSLFALEVNLAEINQVSLADEESLAVDTSRFTEDLQEAVKDFDVINSFSVNRIPRAHKVESLLDASVVSFDGNYYYLMYGTLFKEERWLEARISLYERETDQVITVFYSKADQSRYDELVTELGEKIGRFFYGEYGIEPAEIINKWEGYWEVGGNLGFWGILPEWNQTISGITTLGAEGALALDEPVLYLRDFVIYPKVGLGLEYSTAISKPDYENSVLNSFQILIPFHICAEYRHQHAFCLTMAIGDQIDWLVQSRLYGDTYHAASQAFVFSAGLGYEYMPRSSDWTFGLNNKFDFVLYEEPMLSYKPSVTVKYRFKRSEEE